jgi:hypothetical protein
VNKYGLWSADPLAVAVVEAMERAVTVDLIGTFEPQLVCCAPSDEIVGLLAQSTICCRVKLAQRCIKTLQQVLGDIDGAAQSLSESCEAMQRPQPPGPPQTG